MKLLIELPATRGIDPAALNNYALRLAVINGRVGAVKLLLALPAERGVDPAVNDNYALYWAECNNHTDVVKLLLDLPAERGVAARNVTQQSCGSISFPASFRHRSGIVPHHMFGPAHTPLPHLTHTRIGTTTFSQPNSQQPQPRRDHRPHTHDGHRDRPHPERTQVSPPCEAIQVPGQTGPRTPSHPVVTRGAADAVTSVTSGRRSRRDG